MIDLTGVGHHPAVQEIVEVLCHKTENTDKGFFRTEVVYFLGQMASSMGAVITTRDRGEIPVNIFALSLASSGYGKGYSVNIMENDFLKPFRQRFMSDTFGVIAEQNLWTVANNRAVKNLTDPQEEYEKADREFKSAGAFPFTFDSGTPPAVKQLRHKLLLANCGAINLQIDEIGSNLIGSTDLLNLFLELYDQGQVKQKLVKNTAENQRTDEIEGKTPTNVLLFGTPAKLLDGGPTEDLFYAFLETGYARRCLFGFGHQELKARNVQTAAEIYKQLTQPSNTQTINKWATHFHTLADPAIHGWKMEVLEPVGIRLLEYKMACESKAAMLSDFEEVQKSELSHRHSKALKVAGAYAFIDKSDEIEMHHLMSAILLVEESGECFKSILSREKTYVKLARYIAETNSEVTHADLNEALPFYKSGNAARNELMTMATSWGYKNHIIIKKSFVDGIEFFQGETLKETSMDKMILSYSEHFAYEYSNEAVPFDQLHLLTQADDMHWANHHFRNHHRAEENASSGFNMVVIDVDEGVTLDAVHGLMKDYKFFTHTTKRHRTEGHGDRFRLILPINYQLALDTQEYKDFMNSLLGWLPFKSDESANQRAKKWESYSGGTYHYNMDGETLDALRFIPKTSKNEQHNNAMKPLESLDNMERWFAQRIATGNRNNNLVKYALALVDSGMNLIDVSHAVKAFNAKLSNKLSDDEIDRTILTTVAKRFHVTA